MNSIKATARKAGLIYVVFALLGIVGYLYVPSQFIVADDATATLAKIAPTRCSTASGFWRPWPGNSSSSFSPSWCTSCFAMWTVAWLGFSSRWCWSG